MNLNQLSPYVGLAFTSPNGDVTQALYVREWSSLGTVIIIMWDMLLLFNDEYVHIWRAPSFALKWIYLFTRYFPLLFQSISYYLLTHALPPPPISVSICLAWTLAHIVSTRIMMAVMEGVLMLRVYALYSKSTTVGWFLVALFLMQRVIAIGVAVRVPKNVQFDEICRAKGKRTDTIVLGGGILFTQAVIWTMTVAKRKVGMESRSNSRFWNYHTTLCSRGLFLWFQSQLAGLLSICRD
ncbi:hypothetical protein BDQ12DRAFT_234532 [Crucibulum laeve]|uniref:DUF6533 domain-containing protein n=1 Tax=Crucibulum laeve TaxID=68775 RepID=A0A5C3LGE3_9AGAR|nr:hypothetical protein BDQ12DRAFT_234532 [Crucibulum laeve]